MLPISPHPARIEPTADAALELSMRARRALLAPARARAVLIVSLLLAAATAAAATGYVDLRRAEPIVDGDADAGRAKATVCLACHDASGVATAPIYPSLRGQTVEYLYWSLIDFKRGERTGSVMTPLVANLDDQDLRDLAAFYAARSEQPATATAAATAAGDELARGESLYLHGNPEQGVPPCQGCHGPDGRGHPLVVSGRADAPAYLRTYPALRGQKRAFVAGKLREHRAGTLVDSTNDFIMNGVAASMDDESIEAIAAWLESLPF